MGIVDPLSIILGSTLHKRNPLLHSPDVRSAKCSRTGHKQQYGDISGQQKQRNGTSTGPLLRFRSHVELNYCHVVSLVARKDCLVAILLASTASLPCSREPPRCFARDSSPDLYSSRCLPWYKLGIHIAGQHYISPCPITNPPLVLGRSAPELCRLVQRKNRMSPICRVYIIECILHQLRNRSTCAPWSTFWSHCPCFLHSQHSLE